MNLNADPPDPVKPLDDVSPECLLDFHLVSDLEPEPPSQSHSRFLILCEIINVCFFKMLNSGVIGYVTIDNSFRLWFLVHNSS